MRHTATWAYGHCRLGAPPRTGARVLTYHAVGSPVDGDVRGLYSLSSARFEHHMRYLAEHYAEQLCPLACSTLNGTAPSIALTIDDGYVDTLTVAAPLLARLGIPFTVFLWTGAISGCRAGFLAPEQVRELHALPDVRIGSHTVNHSRLTQCDGAALKSELADSKAYLEDLLGAEIDSISYPHGAVNRRVRDAAQEAGYTIGATSRFDVNEHGCDPLLVCRTDVWAIDDVTVFRQKLRGDWDWMRWRRADPGVGK